MIVANPPYISEKEFKTLEPEVKDYEPKIATTDSGDGFRFIRRIAELSVQRLGNEGMLLLEIAYNQCDNAKRIAHECGLEDVKVFKDLGGNDRILSGRKAA